MALLPELLPIERLEDVASSVRSAMSIATRLSKAGYVGAACSRFQTNTETVQAEPTVGDDCVPPLRDTLTVQIGNI